MKRINIEKTASHIFLSGDYIKAAYDELKASVPAGYRKYIPNEKKWVINISFLDDVVYIFQSYNCAITFTKGVSPIKEEVKGGILRLLYLGVPKDRNDGTISAYGTSMYDDMCRPQWNVIIPQDVLTDHFGVRSDAYGILGIKSSSTDEEIKKSYRRLMFQFHPDFSKDEQSVEQFHKVKKNYELIKTQDLRNKYNRRLAMVEKLASNDSWGGWSNGYIPPKRTGLITYSGYIEFGFTNVTYIQKWEDITNDEGKILIVHYNPDMHSLKESYL